MLILYLIKKISKYYIFFIIYNYYYLNIKNHNILFKIIHYYIFYINIYHLIKNLKYLNFFLKFLQHQTQYYHHHFQPLLLVNFILYLFH